MQRAAAYDAYTLCTSLVVLALCAAAPATLPRLLLAASLASVLYRGARLVVASRDVLVGTPLFWADVLLSVAAAYAWMRRAAPAACAACLALSGASWYLWVARGAHDASRAAHAASHAIVVGVAAAAAGTRDA